MASPQDWLDFAREDLRVVENTITGALHRAACVHAEQAAQKALKAYLLKTENRIPRIHDLVALLQRCQSHDPGLAGLAPDVRRLNPYYGRGRYPDYPGALAFQPTSAEAQEALDAARRILQAVEARV